MIPKSGDRFSRKDHGRARWQFDQRRARAAAASCSLRAARSRSPGLFRLRRRRAGRHRATAFLAAVDNRARKLSWILQRVHGASPDQPDDNRRLRRWFRRNRGFFVASGTQRGVLLQLARPRGKDCAWSNRARIDGRKRQRTARSFVSRRRRSPRGRSSRALSGGDADRQSRRHHPARAGDAGRRRHRRLRGHARHARAARPLRHQAAADAPITSTMPTRPGRG